MLLHMEEELRYMKKAQSLIEIDFAVNFNIPVTPDHPFFVDFREVRGEFEEKVIFKHLNVNPQNFSFNRQVNKYNKTLLFLGGMRGSGKTSELRKYAKNLDNPDCFMCVFCNIDVDLDVNDMEYMDIVILQLEKLIETANTKDIKLETRLVSTLNDWFSQRIKEINTSIKEEGGIELEFSLQTPSLLNQLLKMAGTLKTGILGSRENATIIRRTLKNKFSEFAREFNTFLEYVNIELRKKGIAQETLFIVDGLEKTLTADIRKKIIIDEANRLRQIRANTIFTLPVELMKERQKLITFSSIVSFPFVKIVTRAGEPIRGAIERFKEFVYRRIDPSLFDDESTVEKAIQYGGGSPRELLRLLEYTNIYADETKGMITIEDLDKAIQKLASETSMYITPEEFDKLKIIESNNTLNRPTPFDEVIQGLTEKLIVFEYNDGTYKRVNPLVEASDSYHHYVG